MTDGSLIISQSGIDEVVQETRYYGEQLLETGGFLLSPTGQETISCVAVGGEAGIIRRPRLFQISEGALDRLFTFADEKGFWIPVQFHSHRFGAFLSETDAEHGLSVDGFISVILPTFADPPRDVRSWGWWQFRTGAWHSCAPASVRGADFDSVIVFDENGVYER
jgi:hypothetical protein